MKGDSFYRSTAVLTASNILTGVFSFVFTVTLTHHLGAEGMGLYNLVMPLYNLFICIMSAGIVAALSKVSAIYLEKKEINNLYKTVKTTAFFNLLWSITITLIVLSLNGFLTNDIIKDSRTSLALWIICPAMIFVTLSNILKGFFYGISRVMVPSIIDIFEKAIRIAALLTLLLFFDSTSIMVKLSVAYGALCIGELISLLLLYIYYKFNKLPMKNGTSPVEGRAQLLYNVLSIAVPLCVNGIITNILSTTSALIVPRRLIAAGFNESVALSMIGKFSSMAIAIVFFPMVIIGSINTVLIPDLSKSVSRRDYASSENRIKDVLRLSFVLGLCTLMICTTIPDNLGHMLFKRDDLTQYIRFAALSAPFVYTSVTTYGILNGIGKHNILLRNSVAVSLLELVFLFILTAIARINILGYGITMIISSCISIGLNLYEIKKYYELEFSLTNIIILALCTLFIYYVLKFLDNSLSEDLNTIKNIIIILWGFVLFIISIFITKKSA